MALDDILLEAEEKMIKTEEVVQNEFAGVRTGKASPALVENIQVEVYGSTMRIRELAGISTPEARMLMIQPWDASSIQPIEKAIQKANLGLNPAVQGKFIRLVLPELSQERRVEFTKIVKKMAEDGRVAIRHVRRDALEHLKKAIQKANLGLNPAVQGKFIRLVLPELSQERRVEFTKIVKKMAEDGRVAIRHVRRDALEHLKKEKGVTEDQIEAAEKEIQKLTDQYIGKIDAHVVAKEKEIMTV